MHEVFRTPVRNRVWNNPYKLMEEYRDSLNAISHGVVNYEIVKIIDDDLMFTKLKGADTLLSKESVFAYFYEPDWTTFKSQGTTFDYEAFIAHYDFCTMRDRGEIHEVWVWTFPFAGMWESTFAGEGAFWLNSEPVEGTSCKDLLTVMGLNYERDMSLALESYGHRFESIMWKVYGRWDNKASSKNTWEIYTTYDKQVPGQAHIGNIHFPPNGINDYDWTNKTIVTTHADAWKTLSTDYARFARQVDCSEWDCTHLGYMCWWYRHIPHFQGINKRDGKLNNWWHYVVDYNEAVRLEQQLSTCTSPRHYTGQNGM